MNIDPTNNSMQHINSGDKKSLTSDVPDTHSAKNHAPSQQEPNTDDQVQLSSESKKLQQINQSLKTADGIDHEKVADVKKRLAEIKLGIQQSGSELESATLRIADKIIEMDELFSGK